MLTDNLHKAMGLADQAMEKLLARYEAQVESGSNSVAISGYLAAILSSVQNYSDLYRLCTAALDTPHQSSEAGSPHPQG